MAFDVASTLLLQVTDQTIRATAGALLDRAANAPELEPAFVERNRAVLALRERRYREALVLLDRFRNTPITTLFFSNLPRLPEYQASVVFLRAILCAELGRVDEARRDFAEASEQLKLALGDKPGHDRGSYWNLAYQAEIWQREAMEVFKAKGIPLPEPPVK